MPSFQLKKGNNAFDFDIAGTVSTDGAALGKWTTTKDNKIALNRDGGGQDLFDVAWTFDADNHLILSAGNKKVFDFNQSSTIRPHYSTENAVLKVRPDRNNVFGFELRGEWDIVAHDLAITINGVRSVLDGFIQDPRSRFMYHFFDKKNLLLESVLGFVGEWEMVNKDGVPLMNFKYIREDATTDIFELPKSVTVNRSNNQFLYQYDKAGRTFGIQFVGFLQISDDFKITYALDRQVSQSGQEQVKSTSFTIGVDFVTKTVTGDIEFVVKKTDGSVGTTTLGIKGNFTAKLGSTQLIVGFSFSQTRGPNVITTSVDLTGSLRFGNGGQVEWHIAKAGNTTTISVAASDIRLGPARGDARLNIVRQNGQVAGVTFLFGISF